MIKKDSEFWLRITVVVFLSALVLIAPAILFPFGLSLILALLLRPLAVSIQMVIESWGGRNFLLTCLLFFLSLFF